jgi:uncharacterized membrane protein
MRRIPRTKGAITGFLIVLLGLWGALIPFVGPYFNYAMHSDQTWQWFSDRFWLEVLPGIVAVLGGLILMRGATRASTSFGAMMALAAGLWYIVGPNVSMLWNHGAITIGPPIGQHNITRTLEWLGFFYGLGGLITLFSSYALGFMAALPIVDERVVGRTVATGTAGATAGYAAGRATAPRDRLAAGNETTVAPARTTASAAAADEPTVANDRTVAGDRTATADPTAPSTATATGTRRRGGLFRRRRSETTRT